MTTAPPDLPAAPHGRSLTASAQDAAEVTRLRLQVAALADELERSRRRGNRSVSFRRAIAAVLIVIAAFGTVASVIGVWTARTALDTDRWVSTVAPLPQDPQVAEAVSTYVTGEVLRLLDAEQRIATALPPNAAFIAGPVTGGMRDYVQGVVDRVLQTPQFAELWVGLNRAAHTQVVALLDDRSSTVRAGNDQVTLNLLPVVNNVLGALEQQAPTLFGRDIALPEITDGTIPPGLETRIETALGVQLPADVSKITVYRGSEIGAVQDAVGTFRQYLGVLVVGSVVALALAIWISPGRRRTLLQLGLWLALATAVLGSLIRVVRDNVLAELPAGLYRDGASSAWSVVVSSLRDRADQVFWIGLLLALAAYLAGPGRGARWARRQAVSLAGSVADGGRWLLDERRGRVWVRANLDALRVGGVAAAVVVALVLSSLTSLVVVLVALALFVAAVTLLAQSAEGEVPTEGPVPVEGPAAVEGSVPDGAETDRTISLPEPRSQEDALDGERAPSAAR